MTNKSISKCGNCGCKTNSSAWINKIHLCKRCYAYKKQFNVFPNKEYVKELQKIGKWI